MPKPKKLYRSRKNRVVAGVCGGIADYTRLDPVLIRLVFLLLLLLGLFPLLLGYVIAAVYIPEQPLPGARTIVDEQ